ncbi:hypothetical protein [Lactobacillus helveticus]|uniref:hypothetical protein n=1 Tax=Lactobacillus helveticus TaxID=1587 RepID=UPI001562BAD2|nr:hypothetical protein [Lactobacillus helveticus]
MCHWVQSDGPVFQIAVADGPVFQIAVAWYYISEKKYSLRETLRWIQKDYLWYKQEDKRRSKMSYKNDTLTVYTA